MMASIGFAFIVTVCTFLLYVIVHEIVKFSKGE